MTNIDKQIAWSLGYFVLREIWLFMVFSSHLCAWSFSYLRDTIFSSSIRKTLILNWRHIAKGLKTEDLRFKSRPRCLNPIKAIRSLTARASHDSVATGSSIKEKSKESRFWVLPKNRRDFNHVIKESILSMAYKYSVWLPLLSPLSSIINFIYQERVL